MIDKSMSFRADVQPENSVLKILAFKSATRFRDWLETNHCKSDGVWLRIFKQRSGNTSITYAEALDQALCHGWIDGQKRPMDENSWLQKFTPRSARSSWSKINIEHVGRLIEAGQMKQPGLDAVEKAKCDGRWQAAYDPQSRAVPPDDFVKALAKNRKAKAFFETLNKTNIYSIVYRLQTARKLETREKRIKMILAMLERGEKFHP